MKYNVAEPDEFPDYLTAEFRVSEEKLETGKVGGTLPDTG